MADIRKPTPVKLICGMISANEPLFDAALQRLADSYGPADIVSEIFPFDFTHYYDHESGYPLQRRFVSFERLIDPGHLSDIKRFTNTLEDDFAADPAATVPRPINLDPGYLALSRLILASMKDFAHRIYLQGGVYAEVTLQYRNGWKALPWTFPDYASGTYDAFFTAARQRLHEQENTT